jgi:transcriptional regulator with XRE-family HTH domain
MAIFVPVEHSLKSQKKDNMFIASNLKLLRKRKALTQDETAKVLGIKREKLNNYEQKRAEPPIGMLRAFSKYHQLSIDNLVDLDLTTLSESQLLEVFNGNDIYTKGAAIRVLNSTVNNDNEDNVEIVPFKAAAGYKTGFSDIEYIRKLPTFNLPGLLSKNKKYRMFQIFGDSMLISEKSYVIGEYMQNFNDIKNDLPYVVVTKEEGIVFKMVTNNIGKNRTLLLSSLNLAYEPYSISINEVMEVWKFAYYLSPELPEPPLPKEIVSAVLKLQQNMNKLIKH